MNIPLLDHPIQEKLVTVADVSWEEFKGIEAQLRGCLKSIFGNIKTSGT
jgi:hypothetical protein